MTAGGETRTCAPFRGLGVRLDVVDGALLAIDTRSGEVTQIASVPGLSAGADWAAGYLYALGSTGPETQQLVRIDVESGALTQIATLTEDIGTVGSIVFDEFGNLLGSGFGGPYGSILFDLDPGDGSVSNLRSVTGGYGVDVSIDCSGSTQGLKDAWFGTRPGGTIVVAGAYPASALWPLPAGGFHRVEKTIKGTFYGSVNPLTDFTTLGTLYLEGQLFLDELLIELGPLRRGLEAVLRGVEVEGRIDREGIGLVGHGGVDGAEQQMPVAPVGTEVDHRVGGDHLQLRQERRAAPRRLRDAALRGAQGLGLPGEDRRELVAQPSAPLALVRGQALIAQRSGALGLLLFEQIQ